MTEISEYVSICNKHSPRGEYLGLFIESKNSKYLFESERSPTAIEQLRSQLISSQNESLTIIKKAGENGGWNMVHLVGRNANDEYQITSALNGVIMAVIQTHDIKYCSIEDGELLDDIEVRVWTKDSGCSWIHKSPIEIMHDVHFNEITIAEDLFVMHDGKRECLDCKFCGFRSEGIWCEKKDVEIGRKICERHRCALYMRKH